MVITKMNPFSKVMREFTFDQGERQIQVISSILVETVRIYIQGIHTMWHAIYDIEDRKQVMIANDFAHCPTYLHCEEHLLTVFTSCCVNLPYKAIFVQLRGSSSREFQLSVELERGC
jgi:hypothetical protein